ncbi:MAG TPA: PAS domain S-box protein [Candidatus Methylomirabilis sp.]|nr:PAS domain S-box protein [Candidatus Methylomirabilis sp.]
MTPRPANNPWICELDRLRWLGIWLPVTAIAVLVVLAEGVLLYLDLPEWVTVGAHALMLGVITLGAYLFSTYIFRIVRAQEEEILQKRQELAARERHFRALIENSSDGIVLLNATGVYTYASPSTTRMLGYPPEELVGRSAFEIIHPDDRERAMARTVESLRNPGAIIRAEVRIRHRDGSWRWIEAVVSNLLADPSVQAIVKNYRDVTQRKRDEEALRSAHTELEERVRERTADLVRAHESLQSTLEQQWRAEEALRESQAQLAGVIRSAIDAIITIDDQHRIVVFNAAAERLFRVSAAEVIGQSVQQFIPERFRSTHEAGLRDFARTNLETWWVGMLGGVAGLRRGGQEFPFEAAVSQVEVGGRKLFTVILHDTTAQKEAEAQLRDSQEQLRALSARLLTVREEERARIAQEIHNTVGQALAVLKMDLAWVASRLPDGQTPLAQRSKAMLALINSAVHSVRRIATELRPALLDDLGLVAALEWQAKEFQTRMSIACEFSSSQSDLAVTPAAGTAVFRICQEALTNVARHARATRVSISLGEEEGNLVLRVADNGRGITDQEIANRTSLGLLGMQERALHLGGNVTIAGRSGKGTTVMVRIPLTAPTVQDTREDSREQDRMLTPPVDPNPH